ncbi:hypothetical protein [Planctomicrobium piriforme]|uniref:Uncharacterized protein n=1 Tax=Planctomicrobium piriforme TaxID=1576369 RepID=A0A1I3C1R3_9PLAN|nr:hypothetical protein [Planctomicrobium piriforme]SFH68484.1 hypothetical protein SAMN05421753_10249 [Planctomicrobium piriforme]
MIALTALTATLQQYWAESGPAGIPTQFPGTTLDASGLKGWMEFWLTQGFEPPHRVRTGDVLLVLIDVHCFSRQTEKRAVFEMADGVRSALAQRVIPLGAGQGGSLRIQEAVCRDLTREFPADPRLPLQHVVVSLSGRAEMVLS